MVPVNSIRACIKARHYLLTKHATMVDAKVTYTVEYDGQVYIVEHVPAKVSQETGERYFAPETVERIRVLIKSRRKPDKVVATPVYEYA